MFWPIYYTIGFFLAAGAVTALLLHTPWVSKKLGWEGPTRQTWVWLTIGVGAFVTLFWFPTVMFLAFVGFWLIVLRYIRKYVTVKMPTED